MTRRESAFAISQTIVVGAIVAMIVLIIATATLRGIMSGRAGSARAVGSVAIDSGVDLYRQALESGAASEASNWMIPRSEAAELVGSSGQVVDMSRLTGLPAQLREPIPGAAPWAIRRRSSGVWSYVQPLQAIGPGNGGSGEVVVYLRAWSGGETGESSTPVTTARVAFTPGAFHAFQMVVDGPITFAQGATIDGPVHSNGVGTTGGQTAIGALGPVNCNGEFARVGTSAGVVSGGFSSACRRRATRPPIELGAVRDAFVRLQRASDLTTGRVIVVRGTGGGVVPIRLDRTNVIIGGQSRTIDGSLAVLVRGDVQVSGRTTGRVSIASDPSGGEYLGRGGTITVTGPVGTDGEGVLGLFTEGDVVVDAASCTPSLEAAVIASNGGLTIPRSMRSDVVQLDAPQCPAFSFHGSIAGAEAPTMRWQWPSGGWAGYDRREYSWDPTLVRRPPPFAPVLDGWQVGEWTVATGACTQPAAFASGACR
jgi:hypothetical protein